MTTRRSFLAAVGATLASAIGAKRLLAGGRSPAASPIPVPAPDSQTSTAAFDDAPALQARFDAAKARGGIVYLHGKTYTLGSTLYVDSDVVMHGCTFYGPPGLKVHFGPNARGNVMDCSFFDRAQCAGGAA